MGTSAKRKKEKRADFQKPRLKVGKTKPKADNYTNTSFKAKSIVINKQSISATAPSPSHQFQHHLSLLSHKSDTQRRESLAFLSTVISDKPAEASLPQPFSVIFSKVQPLILDRSRGVRDQLLKLLRSLPQNAVPGHASQFLLYTRAGMTHLAVEIRSSALDVFQWLLSVAGDEVVSCPGGWARTLRCFLIMFGWQTEPGNKTTPLSIANGKISSDNKNLVKQLNILSSFLDQGLGGKDENLHHLQSAADSFPLRHVSQHMIPHRSNCFDHLNLFGSVRNEESQMYEDREGRQGFFETFIWPSLHAGIENARKEGGEVGRIAAALLKTIADNMADFREREA